MPASLYFFWSTRPWLVTLVLVLVYCSIALLMRGRLARLVQRGEGLASPLHRGE